MLSQKIKELYQITNELAKAYPGRKFTVDGHLVGSIGEVIVAEHYDLHLLPNSTPVHDAISADGKKVQIKATQIDRVSLSAQPDYLIVIKLFADGSWEEVFNGLGRPVWDGAGKMQKNGQRSIALSKLRKLASCVAANDMIVRIN